MQLKKTIAILMLISFVTASTELHQLFKLPGLVSHFIQHQKEDNSISLIEFLKMHYDLNSNHNGEHQHENLPFKSHGCMVNHSLLAEICFNGTHLEINYSFPIKEKTNFKEVFYASSVAESIWQPPKYC